MNSSGQIVLDENFEVRIGPHVGSKVENLHFCSESFRTPDHTVGTSSFGSIPLTVHDLYDNLEASLD
jgi:hypothetical protein